MSPKSLPVNDYEIILREGGTIIDVRESDEIATGTLPGAVHIPLGQIPSRASEIDRSRPVALLCRSGARSGQAAVYLAQSGFDEVINLDGGMLAFRGN
ncbi:MAG TPA: rhodanese-like domain-containing protein [Acidimicrobiales bacterium]|nr:rhodanese-like domain-containing protein [Acidimicrobiales bacterium]